MTRYTWKNHLNYKRGDTWESVQRRGRRMLERQAAIGNYGAQQRTVTLLRALKEAKADFATGRVHTVREYQLPGRGARSSVASFFGF